MKSPVATILLLLLFLISFQASAENSTRANGYTVHHNAIHSAMLTPEIANSYRIVRSKYRGLLTISVIKDIPDTTGQPASARVTVTMRNPTGQIQRIPMREIREAEAIYYIGEFPIANQETLQFDLEVIPHGMSSPIRSHLTQQFFVD